MERIMNRKQFLLTAGGGLLSVAMPRLLDAQPGPGKFYFACIADTHIIDDFYKGDEEDIYQTTDRLAQARAFLNTVHPAIDMVFVAGDFFHNYPSTDLDFFFKNRTRVDNAKELIDGFKMPVHVGFGNHDYAIPKVPREMSHELFRRKLGVKPYYSIDHKGVKFVHLNNFLGDTMAAGNPKYNRERGSFGEEQLNWFEAELRQHKPAFVFLHFPLYMIAPTESADLGLLPLLKKYKETVQLVVAGHWHKWVEFGRTYGPPHQVIAATRYDPNAYLIVEMDTAKGTHRLLNIDLVDWNTHYSKPWPGM